MKGLELDVLALIAEHVHDHLEVVVDGDVAVHDGKVGAIEEELAEEFKRLTFGDVVGRLDEQSKGVKELYDGHRDIPLPRLQDERTRSKLASR